MSLLNACFQAMGSPDDHFSITGTGQISEADHPQLPSRDISFKVQGRHRFRQEERLLGQRALTLVNGRRASFKLGTKVMPLALSETVLRVQEYIPGYNCRPDPIRGEGTILYSGQETHAGVLVDHIVFSKSSNALNVGAQMILAKLSALDIYLDASTHMLFAVRRTAFDARDYQNQREVEVRFYNYVITDGVAIPRTLISLLNEQSTTTTTVTLIMAGGISDDDFN